MSNQIYSNSNLLFDLPYALGPDGSGTRYRLITQNTNDAASQSDQNASISTQGGISVNKNLYCNSIQVSTTGGTPKPISFSGGDTLSIKFSCGGGTFSQNITCTIIRTGDQVLLGLGQITLTTGTTVSNVLASLDGVLPSVYRPATTITVGTARVSDNSVFTSGFVLITASGQIQIYKDAPYSNYNTSSPIQIPFVTNLRWIYNI